MSTSQEHGMTKKGGTMPKPFMSQEQYFAGWLGTPVVFDQGSCWVPSSLGVHRNGDEVLYENHWIRASGHMQLEFPWGSNHEAISAGEQLLSRISAQG